MTHLVPVLRPVLGSPFRRGDLYRRAGEIPSFHISPAALGHAGDLITGAVLGTYNSATPAMAVGADGLLFTPAANAPVIEYDAATRACLGARIWGVVTNNFFRSEEFATTWTATGATVTSNAGTSPAGTATADKLQETATTGEHRITQTSTGGATSSAVTLSVFVKPVERTFIRLAFSALASWSGGGGAAVIFNLTTGTATADGSTPTAFGIAPYANGFYRCWITGTPTVSLTPIGNIFLHTGATGSYSGVDGNGVLLFGGQLNPGLIAPYVPTTTTAASSTADAWSITGADFNRIYNQSAVTLYAEAERGVVPTGDLPVLVDARNAAASSIIQIGYLTENLAGNYVTTGNVLQSEAYPSGLAGIRRRRIASAFGTNDVAISANGSVPIADATATMPTPDRINIAAVGNSQNLNGYIRELAIFRSRRPNANLQALTT